MQRARARTHSHVEILHYTVIVSACQMAPDICQRLGIKLSERLLPRPPTLFSHPPSLGIINFIISVIIIVKLFFIFLHFFPSPPLLAQNTKCMLMCFGDCQRTRRWGEVERNENERGCEMGRGETERRKDAGWGGARGGGWHEEEQESNEVGRQVEGRRSVGGEEGGEVFR